MRALLAALAGSAAALAGAPAHADEVGVAVASNFAGVMTRLGAAFEAASGHVLRVSAGSTGRLYSQIVAGAPFDVLLAADEETLSRLLAEGRAVAGSRFTYATGRLVLWSPQPGLVDDQGAVLASQRFERLAIANPKLAPYGAAAMQVLHGRGLADAVAARLVTGENIAQAYQFVATGNAELGFVAWSQVISGTGAERGSLWRVPASLHRPLRQDAALLLPGRDKAAAHAFLQYLRGPAARDIILAHGYGR